MALGTAVLAGGVALIRQAKTQRDKLRLAQERTKQAEQRKVWQQRAEDRAQRDGDGGMGSLLEQVHLRKLYDRQLRLALQQLERMLAEQGGEGSGAGGSFGAVPLLSGADSPQLVLLAAEVLFMHGSLGVGQIKALPHTFGVEQLSPDSGAVLLDWLARVAFTRAEWYTRHGVSDPQTWPSSADASHSDSRTLKEKKGQTLGCLWRDAECALASFSGEAFAVRSIQIGSGRQLRALTKAASVAHLNPKGTLGIQFITLL